MQERLAARARRDSMLERSFVAPPLSLLPSGETVPWGVNGSGTSDKC